MVQNVSIGTIIGSESDIFLVPSHLPASCPSIGPHLAPGLGSVPPGAPGRPLGAFRAREAVADPTRSGRLPGRGRALGSLARRAGPRPEGGGRPARGPRQR